MNSLDKMEDYYRMRQERDELAAQVEVMLEALKLAITYNQNDMLLTGKKLHKCRFALSITPSAALREIEARTLENAAETDFVYGISERLRQMAAAIRKGE